MFFRQRFLGKGRRLSSTKVESKKIIKTIIENAKPSQITNFKVFNVLESESNSIKFIEKIALLAAICEVIAVITKLCSFQYSQECVYAALYASVIITVFLPIAKFFDSTIAYRKLKQNLKQNSFDRALILSFFFGVWSVIGSKKLTECADESHHLISKIKNSINNFWDNTKIHGNFPSEFENIFGEKSFDKFLSKIKEIEGKYIEQSQIHEVISAFFCNKELWENQKIRRMVKIVSKNFLTEEEEIEMEHQNIMESLDYIILTYFKYGKSEVIYDIERLCDKKRTFLSISSRFSFLLP